MSFTTVLLFDVVEFFEKSRVPLALICASPWIRRACEKKLTVDVGAWALRLADGDLRNVAWRLSASMNCCRAAGAMRSVAWWCNRSTHSGCKALPLRLDLTATGSLLGSHLHTVLAFRSLVELTLRGTSVEDVNVLGQLPMLERLDLVQARVVNSGITGLGESKSLVDVNMWGCTALTEVNALGKVPTLRRLVLSETCVSDGGIAGLVSSPTIEEVNLEACALVKNVGFFAWLLTLKRLLLVTTPVDNNGIMALCNSTSLLEIDLWGCKVVNDVGSLGKIPTLQKLILFGTSVTNEGIAGLGRSNSLEEIDLTCCGALTDVRALAGIPTLRRLRLLHTSVHDISELVLTGLTVTV